MMQVSLLTQQNIPFKASAASGTKSERAFFILATVHDGELLQLEQRFVCDSTDIS